MIDKQFIVDDINDFKSHSKSQYIYFDRAECKTILDAIQKAYKYENISNTLKDLFILKDERLKFADWCKNNNIQCRKKLDGEWVQFSVRDIVDEYEKEQK